MESTIAPAAPKKEIKVTIYYWPKVNAGLGHIACTVSEIGSGPNISTYLTPSTSLYMEEELIAWESSNVVKIELPAEEMSYDVFLERFEARAQESLSEHYNLVTNNCAHLTDLAISTVYDVKCKGLQWGLTPHRVAINACSHLLGAKNVARLETMANMSDTGTDRSDLTQGNVSRISKYQFAKLTMYTLLSNMDELVKENAKGDALLFSFVKTQFLNALGKTPINDEDITQGLKELYIAIKSIAKKLSGEHKSAFGKLKIMFYELTRIVSKDPALENLRNFRKEASKIDKQLNFKELSTKPESKPNGNKQSSHLFQL